MPRSEKNIYKNETEFTFTQKLEYKNASDYKEELLREQKFLAPDQVEASQEEKEQTHESQFADEITALMIADSKAILERATAEGTAAGEPVAEFQPVYKGFWGIIYRIRDAFRVRNVKKKQEYRNNASLDHVGLRCAERVEAYREFGYNEVDKALKTLNTEKKDEKETVDRDALAAMCRRYEKDAGGNPISNEGRQAKTYNKEMTVAFASKDLKEVRPYLEDLVRDCLKTKVGIGLANPRYIQDHPQEFAESMDKLKCFFSLKDQDWLKPFFDELPSDVMSLITAKNETMGSVSEAANRELSARGVSIDQPKGQKISKGDSGIADIRQDAKYQQAMDSYMIDRDKLLSVVRENLWLDEKGEQKSLDDMYKVKVAKKVIKKKESFSIQNFKGTLKWKFDLKDIKAKEAAASRIYKIVEMDKQLKIANEEKEAALSGFTDSEKDILVYKYELGQKQAKINKANDLVYSAQQKVTASAAKVEQAQKELDKLKQDYQDILAKHATDVHIAELKKQQEEYRKELNEYEDKVLEYNDYLDDMKLYEKDMALHKDEIEARRIKRELAANWNKYNGEFLRHKEECDNRYKTETNRYMSDGFKNLTGFYDDYVSATRDKDDEIRDEFFRKYNEFLAQHGSPIIDHDYRKQHGLVWNWSIKMPGIKEIPLEYDFKYVILDMHRGRNGMREKYPVLFDFMDKFSDELAARYANGDPLKFMNYKMHIERRIKIYFGESPTLVDREDSHFGLETMEKPDIKAMEKISLKLPQKPKEVPKPEKPTPPTDFDKFELNEKLDEIHAKEKQLKVLQKEKDGLDKNKAWADDHLKALKTELDPEIETLTNKIDNLMEDVNSGKIEEAQAKVDAVSIKADEQEQLIKEECKKLEAEIKKAYDIEEKEDLSDDEYRLLITEVFGVDDDWSETHFNPHFLKR